MVGGTSHFGISEDGFYLGEVKADVSCALPSSGPVGDQLAAGGSQDVEILASLVVAPVFVFQGGGRDISQLKEGFLDHAGI